MAGNTPQYYGSVPTIAQAFQNDPRTKLAASALQAGTSTAPVAQGGWGVTDGLARAAQAIVGAYGMKQQDQKYSAREQAYVKGMQDAAALASAAPAAGGGLAAAAGALGGGMPAGPVGAAPTAPMPAMAPPPQPMPNAAPAPVSGQNPGIPAGNPLAPPGGAMPNPMAGGTGPSRGTLAVNAAGVVKPQMETVPNAPAAPPVQAPAAPALPQMGSSSRVAMAQKLIQTGNPDLMEIAQTYLDKGLDEQHEDRTLASKQAFEQSQTGYKSALDDSNAARADARTDAYASRREAIGRNFQREERYGDQTFRAGESAKERSFQHSENAASRAFQAQQQISSQRFSASESALDRDNRLKIAGIRADGTKDKGAARSAYFNTPTGLKMRQKAGEDIDANNNAIQKYERFLDLNKRERTGGVALNTPGVGAVLPWSNSNLAEMNALANDTTLAKIGGSLGTAISDGDRSFITDSNIGVGKPSRTNANIARATIGALRRKNDYTVSFANAEADGTSGSFQKEWAAFVNSTPIVKRNAKGDAVADDKPITFEDWKASLPTYNASGKRVR